MDVLSGGLNQGNLIVTSVLLLGLIIVSRQAKMLDSPGIFAAAALGFIVGALGHWTWLLILLSFLLSSHKATKWRFEEKKARGMSESDDGHRSYGNVIANGGLPGIVAVFAFICEDWYNGLWMFSAAVAVASSDTFASEIGCQPCEPGMNGGCSLSGQKAAFAGSIMIATLTFFAWMATNADVDNLQIGLQKAALVTIIGWLGCQMDSLLGAVFENRGYLTKGGVNGISITCGMLAMWAVLSSGLFA